MRQDSLALLQEVGDEGLACLDSSVSRSQLQAQLNSKSGLLYAVLFDTKMLRSTLSKWGAVPGELVSFHDYFASHANAVLVFRGEAASGVFQWQMNPNAVDLYSLRFEYRRDKRTMKYVVASIGCN